MKKTLVLFFIAILAMAMVVGCTTKASEEKTESSYKYYTAEETKKAIENQEDLILLDIQVEEEWAAHHIKGAIPTHAYPVKTDEEKAKLDNALEALTSEAPIVIVCPGGAGGAQRTIDYLITQNIDENRLYILENGQGGWPYDELLEK